LCRVHRLRSWVMKGTTHRIVGVTAVAAAGHMVGVDPVVNAGLCVAAGVASRLPDKLEIRGLLEHRKVTHWPETAMFFTAVTAWMVLGAHELPVTVGATGVMLGYWLHLAGDACTVFGLPLGPVLRRFWWFLSGRGRDRSGRAVLRRKVWLLPRGWRFTVGETVRDRQGRPLRDRRGRVVRRDWSRGEVRFLVFWLFFCGAVFMLM
jgi:hypothetical protein